MDIREIDINKVNRVIKALLKNGDQKRAALVIGALKKKYGEDKARRVIMETFRLGDDKDIIQTLFDVSFEVEEEPEPEAPKGQDKNVGILPLLKNKGFSGRLKIILPALSLLIFMSLIGRNFYISSSIKETSLNKGNRKFTSTIESKDRAMLISAPQSKESKKAVEEMQQEKISVIKEILQPIKKEIKKGDGGKIKGRKYNLTTKSNQGPTGPVGYLIELKNGAQIITNNYWDQGDQVKYFDNKGIVGIQKDYIKRIEKSPEFYREPPKYNNKSATFSVPIENNALKKEQISPIAAENIKISKRFMKDYFLLKKRFKDSRSMTEEELYQFSEDLIRFRNKILKNRLGTLYSEQIQEIYSMLDEVENIILSK